MSEKSYVGMARCFFCGEFYELLLDRRLRNSLPRDCGVIDVDPCNQCQSWMKQGIIVLGVTHPDEDMKLVEAERQEWLAGDRKLPFVPDPRRSGHFLVIKDEYIPRILKDADTAAVVLECRWMFMDAKLCDLLNEQEKG